MCKAIGLLLVLGVFAILFAGTVYTHGLLVATLTWLSSIVISAALAYGIRLLVD